VHGTGRHTLIGGKLEADPAGIRCDMDRARSGATQKMRARTGLPFTSMRGAPLDVSIRADSRSAWVPTHRLAVQTAIIVVIMRRNRFIGASSLELVGSL
jgi:hypothetical protein